jgi:hypothetical protein
MVHYNVVVEFGGVGDFGGAKALLVQQYQDFCACIESAVDVSDVF